MLKNLNLSERKHKGKDKKNLWTQHHQRPVKEIPIEVEIL